MPNTICFTRNRRDSGKFCGQHLDFILQVGHVRPPTLRTAIIFEAFPRWRGNIWYFKSRRGSSKETYKKHSGGASYDSQRISVRLFRIRDLRRSRTNVKHLLYINRSVRLQSPSGASSADSSKMLISCSQMTSPKLQFYLFSLALQLRSKMGKRRSVQNEERLK